MAVRWRSGLAMLLALSVAGSALGQEKNKKLYRWVDRDGKVHYVDVLPPEAVDQARREFSATSGAAIGTVERALTPEEQAERDAASKQAAETAAQLEQQKRTEEAILASYQTEADLRRAYDTRIDLLKQTLISTDAGLTNLRSTINGLLTEAAEAELENRPMDEKRAASIRGLHAEWLKQQTLQVNRQMELQELQAEFDAVLKRFKAAHAAAAPEPAPPPEPADSASQPTPP